MSSQPIFFYSGTPFTPNWVVDLVDQFTGDGTTTTFFPVNNTTDELGQTIQAGNLEYYFYNQGFTVNSASGSFTLATAPPVGTQIVAPGLQQAAISAFDQNTVTGVVNPRVAQIPLWLVDPLNINNNKYFNLPSYPGMQVSIVNMISGANAQVSWTQLACADASGNAMTYAATGTPLYLPPLNAFTTLASTTIAGASSLFVVAASSSSNGQFWPGQYIRLNIGNSTQEVLHVIAVDYANNKLTIDPSGTTYAHSPDETIFACGWKFFLQVTVPLNANNNTAVNTYNLGPRLLAAIEARP